jgi:hypothetical protein
MLFKAFPRVYYPLMRGRESLRPRKHNLLVGPEKTRLVGGIPERSAPVIPPGNTPTPHRENDLHAGAAGLLRKLVWLDFFLLDKIKHLF